MSQTTDASSEDIDFSQQLTAVQPRLYGYILSLLPDVEAALDVLQETNLVLWRKSAEFIGGQFPTWACGVARFQVMAHRRDLSRERKLFSDQFVEDLADEFASHVPQAESMQPLLEKCLEKLSPQNRELISARYSKGGSVNKLARKYNKSADAISSLLYRLRESLQTCIHRSLPKEHSW